MFHETPESFDASTPVTNARALQVVMRLGKGEEALSAEAAEDFRFEARYLIEAALEFDAAGAFRTDATSTCLKTGDAELRLQFSVEDAERAERIVRQTVRGTSYDRIARIEPLPEYA